MRLTLLHGVLVLSALAAGCGGSDDAPGPNSTPEADAQADQAPGEDAGPDSDTDAESDGSSPDGAFDSGSDGGPTEAGTDAPAEAGCGTPAECAAAAEQRAADNLSDIQEDESALKAFLRDVPKGGDLHHHLSGAVYAETFLDWATTEGGYCISTSATSLATNCGGSGVAPIPAPGEPLYDKVIAEWSMEGFVPTAAETGHDHFFATFGKFGAMSGTHHGKMLADVMQRAASENEVYIELMLTSNSAGGDLGEDTWSANHAGATLTAAALPAFYAELAASPGLAGAVQPILNDVQNSENTARQALECDSAQPQAGCSVGTRYMVYISRSGNVAGVFGQMVAAFEAAIQEPRLVALNLVGPEDGSGALSRYDLEMAMLDYLHGEYQLTAKSPLRISLHAGELTPEYTPSSYDIGTINHIRKAVQIAHAERIGHGLDVMLESDPDSLLEELDQKNVLVEICLSSNIQILEVSGANHPLATYISAGVPVALATDDQAVSRSSIAGEYLRAVQDQLLDYRRLKTMARDSLDHSFLPGESLWVSVDPPEPISDCDPGTTSYLGEDPPPTSCAQFLSGSERARMQWELERRFHVFEAAQ